jgi:hypothetical protein
MEGVGKMRKNFNILMIPAQDIYDPDIAVTVRELKNGGYEAESNLGVKQAGADPVMLAYASYLFSLEKYKNKEPDGD